MPNCASSSAMPCAGLRMPCTAARAKSEGNISDDREVGKQAEVLEHEPDAPLLGRQIRHLAAVDHDASGRRAVKPRDHFQAHRLAGAVRAEQHQDLAGIEREVDVAQRELTQRQAGRLDCECGARHRPEPTKTVRRRAMVAEQNEERQRHDEQQQRHAGGLVEAELQEQLVNLHRRRHRIVGQDRHGGEFADRACIGQGEAGHDAAPRQRQGDVHEDAPRPHTECARHFLEARVDRFETDLRGVHGVGRGYEQHSDHNPRQSAPEPQAEDMAGRSADQTLPPEHDQQSDAGHRVRNRKRQIDDGGDDFLAAKFAARKNIGQRYAEQRGHARGQEGRQKTEPDRLADVRHGGHPGEISRGLHRGEPDQRHQDERQQQAADEPEHQDDAGRSLWNLPQLPGQGLTMDWMLSGILLTLTA